MKVDITTLAAQFESAKVEVETLGKLLAVFCEERHISKGPNGENLDFLHMSASDRFRWAGFIARMGQNLAAV